MHVVLNRILRQFALHVAGSRGFISRIILQFALYVFVADVF